jgi:hypothetical protein
VAPQAYRIDSNEHAPGTILVNQVRVPPGFSFSKETTQRSVADWLNLVEHFCVSFRVAHPVAMASTHLQDAALHWFLTWLDTRDPHTISWSDFRAAMLASPLVDPGSVQALLEQALAQWEREHLKGPERREARLKRQACTFCGISGHRASQCPAKGTPSVNAVAHQEIRVDTENGEGAAY